MHKPILADLVDLLIWDGNGRQIISDWPTAYFEALTRHIERLLVDSDCFQVALSMLQSERNVLLGGPEIAWRAFSDDSTGVSYWLTRYVLSQLGDDMGMAGLHLDRDFAVDFGSEYTFPDRGKDEHLERYSEAEGRDVTDLLQVSLCDVGEQIDLAKIFTLTFTNWIVCRKDTKNPRSFTSGSFDKHAGVTYLTNPLSFRGQPDKIFDAALHEAIHAAIYMFEVLDTPLCGDKREDVYIESPWTGRQLTLDQYSQACFVWWGLFNFWDKYPRYQQKKANANATFYRDRALAGLENDPVLGLMANPVAFERLSSSAKTALTAIREACRENGII